MSDQTIPRRAIAVGEIFGRLTVISEAPKRGKRRYFLCQCSCGSPVKEVRRDSIGSHTLSCGCLQKEIAIESATKTGKLNTRHGKSTTPEYQAWQNMWIRCTDPRSLDYNGYNSRTPPDEWQNFEVFLADMGSRPSAHYSLERKDNNKNYGPDNCKWATVKEQARNKSNTVNIEYLGQTKCVAEWAEELGMTYALLYQRLFRYKWPIEKAFIK